MSGSLLFSLSLLSTLYFLLSSCNRQPAPPQPSAVESPVPVVEPAPEILDRIILTNGGVIEGRIVDETSAMIRIEWQNGEVGFARSEIAKIERRVSAGSAGGLLVPDFESEAKKDLWPAGADHVVTLTNGERIGGRVTRKAGSVWTVRQQLEGGGAIEHDLELNRIEKVDLWPPPQKDLSAELQRYSAGRPALKLIQKGYYHLLTSEQDPLELKQAQKTLDQIYHDFLIHFFDLIDLAETPPPLDVVYFGTRAEFDAALKEFGYSARSNPIGFYHFNTKKLILFNAMTERDVQGALARAREYQARMDKLKAEAEGRAGIDVQKTQDSIDRAREEAARDESRIIAEARKRTANVIRHEGAHQLFHLLGITQTGIYQGGWLIEGLAVYCETEPIGEAHEDRVMDLRFELEQHDLMPLEFLLNFGRGSDFHKMDPLYSHLAYAQSWAFIHFLMRQSYRDGFLNYLRELREQGPEFNADLDRKLLEQHTGKGLKEMENELLPCVKKLIQESIDEKTYQDYRMRLVRAG